GTLFTASGATAKLASTMTGSNQGSTGVPITKAGAGTLTLGTTALGSNFTGQLNINEGVLIAANANALGSPNAGTIVNNGAQLQLAYPSTQVMVGEPLTLFGMGGAAQDGALLVTTGTVKFASASNPVQNLTLNANTA